jgi:4-hydroxybenzoate polyprenyltransferase/phosphoserine phosphatase
MVSAQSFVIDFTRRHQRGVRHREVMTPARTDVPLVFDLDGTLVKSDVFLESALQLVGREPLGVFKLLGWVFLGKAELKRRVAARIPVDAATLRYEQRLLEMGQQARAVGREVVLATAAAESHAAAIAAHTGFFDRILASGNGENLSAHRKARALRLLYGEKGFDYAGNSRADAPVWRAARHAIIVNPLLGAATAAHANARVIEQIDERPPLARSLLDSLRVHQWAKNLLVFLPLLTAHRFTDLVGIGHLLAAFAALSLVASAVYIINDLLDLPHDRMHPTKRNRPLASGALPIQYAIAATPVLLIAGFAVAIAVSLPFAGMVAIYFALTLGYSLMFKRVAILDVLVLSLLYTVRVLAGAVAIPVPASFWLLAFSSFFFLSLAMLKRYVEIESLAAIGVASSAGRGYTKEDAPMIATLGTAAGLVSVLVMALYIESPAVAALYSNPEILWTLGLVLLFWVGRIWLLAHRGEVHDDPVVFALTDRTSFVVAVLSGVIIWAAKVL